MTLAYQYAGGYNTFIPTTDATAQGGLVVEFSRNPDAFHVNKYTTLLPVEIEAGRYWRFDQNAMARVLSGDGSQFIWADGADRPAQNIWQGFELPGYVTTRMNFGFLLGDLAKYHAAKAGGVDLVSVNSKTVAGAAMVQRTRKAIARLTDTSVLSSFTINGGANTGTIPSTAGTSGSGLYTGQYWDAGSTTAPYFRKGVNSILALIVQLTNAMVQPKDVNIIMNPNTATALGAGQEVEDYVKQSPFALASLHQDATFGNYGLPASIFGAAKIVVEDTSYVSANAGSNAQTRAFVVPDGTVIFASRPGGIEGAMMSYATAMGFFLEEMSVEVFDVPQHRYTMGNVVDNYDYQIVAPISGFIVKSAISGT